MDNEEWGKCGMGTMRNGDNEEWGLENGEWGVGNGKCKKRIED